MAGSSRRTRTRRRAWTAPSTSARASSRTTSRCGRSSSTACRRRSCWSSGVGDLWLAIAIPVGIISAVRRRSLLDRTTMITSLAFISAPVFWLGLVALYLFAERRGGRPHLPRHRQLQRRRDVHRQGRVDDPALAGPGCGDRGDLRALRALADDRRDVRGLHPNGARQGPLGAAGRAQARRCEARSPRS